jgi:hypothetical protein
MRRTTLLLLLIGFVTGCSGDSSQGADTGPPSRPVALNFVTELIRDLDGRPKEIDCGQLRDEVISCDARWTGTDGADCQNTFEVRGSDTSPSLASDWRAICIVGGNGTITDINDL